MQLLELHQSSRKHALGYILLRCIIDHISPAFAGKVLSREIYPSTEFIQSSLSNSNCIEAAWKKFPLDSVELKVIFGNMLDEFEGNRLETFNLLRTFNLDFLPSFDDINFRKWIHGYISCTDLVSTHMVALGMFKFALMCATFPPLTPLIRNGCYSSMPTHRYSSYIIIFGFLNIANHTILVLFCCDIAALLIIVFLRQLTHFIADFQTCFTVLTLFFSTITDVCPVMFRKLQVHAATWKGVVQESFGPVNKTVVAQLWVASCILWKVVLKKFKLLTTGIKLDVWNNVPFELLFPENNRWYWHWRNLCMFSEWHISAYALA